MTVQAVASVNGARPGVSVVASRKGFKAELDDLRQRMRGLGFSFDEIAAELARRYRTRPRESYRLAYGWTLDHAAARFNAVKEGTEHPEAGGSLTGSRLSEFERWPETPRKPSVHVLHILAEIYDTDVLCLLDLADHEHLAPPDRLVLLRRPHAGTPFGEKLLSLMEARGLSLREVARRVPCSAAHMSHMSRGQRGPSEQMAARLDEILNAGGELAALAEIPARTDLSAAGPASCAHTPGPAVVNPHGVSLSLPYVPGRVVIEISGPGAGSPGGKGLT